MDRVRPRRRRGYARLSNKRQVTPPLKVVQDLALAAGDELKVEVAGDTIILRREDDPIERRRKALAAAAGSLPGVYEPGYLASMRDEWR
jgi:antitoxin component of MazEF toxin-antitoxin module